MPTPNHLKPLSHTFLLHQLSFIPKARNLQTQPQMPEALNSKIPKPQSSRFRICKTLAALCMVLDPGTNSCKAGPQSPVGELPGQNNSHKRTCLRIPLFGVQDPLHKEGRGDTRAHTHEIFVWSLWPKKMHCFSLAAHDVPRRLVCNVRS